MKPFSRFIISHFEWDKNTLEAKFHYAFDDQEHFSETINFSPLKNTSDFPLINQDSAAIHQLLSHLHIALGVSYYKLYPTAEIIVETIPLSDAMKDFWHDFYIKGLGEFFYRNQINPTGLAQFLSTENKQENIDSALEYSAEKVLILFGWGKDSLVSVELTKQKNLSFDLFSFGKEYPLHQIAQAPTWAKRLIIQRTLDLPQIQKLLAEGYYNGHLPITGIICFVTAVVSYLYGYKSVITSLEKSADFWNTEYHGLNINHQRSKSSEFEESFRKYAQTYLLKNFECKSLIRNRYEIKVVQEFSKYPQYFHAFSSCNRNFHITTCTKLTWDQLRCWECPKCAFVYTMLRAFIEKSEVNEIFWADLFEKVDLIPLFKELLWIEGIKPFECVGTNEEMTLALWIISKKEKKSDSPIMKLFEEKVKSTMTDSDFDLLEKKLLWK